MGFPTWGSGHTRGVTGWITAKQIRLSEKGSFVVLATLIIHMFNHNCILQRQPIRREETPLSRLTSGSAMMIRILRSDAVVKLANRLLRTYSPGLLSGSTLMGIMAGGPFSPWGQQTGGTGGLLYPFPTGEATEAACKKKKNERERKTRWKTALLGQTLTNGTGWATDKLANTELLRRFQTWT